MLCTQPKAEDSELAVNFTLTQLSLGINETFHIFRNVSELRGASVVVYRRRVLCLQAKCPVCYGLGAVPEHRHTCLTCNGTGYIKNSGGYGNTGLQTFDFNGEPEHEHSHGVICCSRWISLVMG